MIYDAVILGGGPAGLQAALMLGRACRSVLLCDTGEPRNAPAPHSHGFFTRDGAPPRELLALGRADLRAYPRVELRDVAITGAELREGGFTVALATGEAVSARGLIIASGVRDQLPDTPGFREHWGRSVFACPYCHGWEVRGQPLAVYGQDAYAEHMVTLIRAWSDDVVLVSDGPLGWDAAARARLARLGVGVEEGVVVGLEGDADGLQRIRFADGSSLARRALLYRPPFTPRSDIPTRLGAAFGDNGLPVATDPFYQTTVPGLYVVGDLAQMAPSVLLAAASGSMAGAGLNHALAARDAR